MHNPYLVVALAVWVTVFFVGLAIGVGTRPTGPETRNGFDTCHYTKDGEKRSLSVASAEGRQRRIIAGSVAAAVGVVMAACWGLVLGLRGKWNTVTYWAGIAILLFGGMFAVYLMTPKLPMKVTFAAREHMEDAKWKSACAAFASAAAAYLAAWLAMQKLPPKSVVA